MKGRAVAAVYRTPKVVALQELNRVPLTSVDHAFGEISSP